jgi:hypothetical protein
MRSGLRLGRKAAVKLWGHRVVLTLLFINVAGWFTFIEYHPERKVESIGGGLSDIGLVCVMVYVATAIAVDRRSTKTQLILGLITGVSVILFDFSIVYLIYGTSQNFGARLTHLDAFYFSLGIFTTAGTGIIAPISGPARAIVSCQYVIDLIYIAGTISIGIAQITSRRGRREEEPRGQ